MNIETLKNTLPEFAKDMKLNLGSLETIENLSKEQVYATMIELPWRNKRYYR